MKIVNNVKSNPKVSVIMSVYNAEQFLQDAIESILNQTFHDFEFLIMDDHSTDRGVEIIRSYSDFRIKFIQLDENIGLAAALNIGMQHAKGKYIARMDADDVSDIHRIQVQYDFLEQHPDVVVAGCWTQMISMEGEPLYIEQLPLDSYTIKKALPVPSFVHGSVMIRTEVVRQIGGYKPQFRNRQDVILWIDLSKIGEFANINQSLYHFRITPTSNQRKSKRYIRLQDELIMTYNEKGEVNTSLFEQMDPLGGGLTPDQRYSEYHLLLGKIYIEKRFDRRRAFYHLKQSVKYNMMNYIAFFNIFLLLLPQLIIGKWKAKRLRITMLQER